MIKTIFITGISGYIAKACAASLIKKGYVVKGGQRDLKKGRQVKAAWDVIAENNHIKLTTINPTLVWGQGLPKKLKSTSLDLFSQLMNKKNPFVPCMKLHVVDIRDVGSMHIAALETDDFVGQRFLLSEGEYRMV